MITSIKYYGLILVLALSFSCAKSKPTLESVLHDHSTTERFVIYTDSIAYALTFTEYTKDSVIAITNRFSKYLPLQIYKGKESYPDSLFLVDFNITTDHQQSDAVNIAVPRSYGSKLRFKAFTDYFGPAQIKDSLLLKTKMPTPEIIPLVKHFNKNNGAPDLLISNTSRPDQIDNQIYYITILKKK